MRKLLIGLMFLACVGLCFATTGAEFGGYLKLSTATTITVGPFVDHSDTNLPIAPTLATTHAVIIQQGGAVDLDVDHLHASATDNDLVMIATTNVTTSSMGTFELTAANTDTLESLIIILDEPGVTTPLIYTYTVVTADYYNMMFTASTIATAADIAAAVNQDVSISALSAFGTCTKNAIVLADDDFAVLYDPVYCPILIVDATDGKTYTRICTGYANRTLTIFPSLPITPVTGDTVYMRRTFSGLLTSDIQQFIQR